jgi:transcriptional regulator with XRE-family HTH domain
MGKPPVEEEAPPEIKEFYAAVGRRIKTLREAVSLSQKDLADISAMRQPYIFETEKHGVNLTLKSLFRVAEALGVPVRDLLPGPAGDDDYETKYRLLREKALQLCKALTSVQGHHADIVTLVDKPDGNGVAKKRRSA